MMKSYKVRLEPNKTQTQILWQSTGTARFIYNWTLARQEENYKNGGKFISDNDLRKEITILKKVELPWLNEVSNNVAKQAVKDACESFKRFFKKQAEFPRFKSRKKSKPSFYNDTSKIKFTESHVMLEKIGWVKLSEVARIPMGKYFNPRITNDGLHWYISVGIEEMVTIPVLTDESIGIDLGIKDLAIVSNIDKPFKNINKSKKVKKLKKKLRRLQRKVSKKYLLNKKGESYVKTSNIIKIEKDILKVHKNIANVRHDYIHKTTTEIVKTKPARVVMEDLNVTGMMKNKHLSKAIAEQYLYEFYRQMEYKCLWNGIEFVTADRWYPSSKTCSECGHIKANLSLSERTFVCECGAKIDRDKNASINLANYKLA